VAALATASPAGAAELGTVAGVAALNGIACPSTGRCVAVGSDPSGNGKSAIITTSTGATKPWAGHLKSAPMFSVACASSTKCVAITGNIAASVAVSTGAMAIRARLNPPPGEVAALGSIACPSSTACYAVGFEGTQLASTAVVAHLSSTGALLGTTKSSSRGIGAIACSSSTTCLMGVANGTAPEWIQLLSSGHFGTKHVMPAKTYVQAISCYKAALCFALAGITTSGVSDELFPLNPTTGAIGTKITISGLDGVQLACSSASECRIVGFKSVSGKPVSGVIAVSHGKAGTFTKLAGSLSDIACSSTSDCYAVGTTPTGAIVDRI
jgi:hypothetical protein